MKWSEFKEYVDSKIKELGEDQDPEIDYIDISYPDISHVISTPYIVIDMDGMSIN